MRTDDKHKTGHCFDLKQLANLKEQTEQYVKWNNVMYIEDTHESPKGWKTEYEEMCNSILSE